MVITTATAGHNIWRWAAPPPPVRNQTGAPHCIVLSEFSVRLFYERSFDQQGREGSGAETERAGQYSAVVQMFYGDQRAVSQSAQEGGKVIFTQSGHYHHEIIGLSSGPCRLSLIIRSQTLSYSGGGQADRQTGPNRIYFKTRDKLTVWMFSHDFS